MSSHRIIFFGTPEFAVSSLRRLFEADFDVEAVVTTPDESMGRKSELTPPPVKVFAQEKGLKVLQPLTLKDDSFFEEFTKINPDICIVVAYGKIIHQRYLDIPKYGFVNIHPSLLPRYRGPSPIQSAILNGDLETGVTLMRIDQEMDHGPILKQIEYSISKEKNYEEIEKELAEIGAQILVDTLPDYLNGKIASREQDHKQATFCKKYERPDGRIDWSKSAEQIYNQIRALNPNPGVWTTLNNKTLNIFEAEIVEHDSQGRVIKEKSRLLIHASDKYLSLTLLQLEGKKILPIKDFLNGLRNIDIHVQ